MTRVLSKRFSRHIRPSAALRQGESTAGHATLPDGFVNAVNEKRPVNRLFGPSDRFFRAGVDGFLNVVLG